MLTSIISGENTECFTTPGVIVDEDCTDLGDSLIFSRASQVVLLLRRLTHSFEATTILVPGQQGGIVSLQTCAYAIFNNLVSV